MDTNINTCTCTTNITTIGLSGKELAKKMATEIHCMDSVVDLLIYCGKGAETQVLIDIYHTHRKKLEELMIQMDNCYSNVNSVTFGADSLDSYGSDFGTNIVPKYMPDNNGTNAVPTAPDYIVSCGRDSA